MSTTSCRSISYAPDRAIEGSPSQPEWTICRNSSVFPVPDRAVLERWTEQGRIRPDDYLVNHSLDVCIEARDVAELDVIFRKARAHVLRRIWRALAFAALGLVWLAPLFGSLILMGAIGAASLGLWTLHHRPSCRFSMSADGREGDAGGRARPVTVRAA